MILKLLLGGVCLTAIAFASEREFAAEAAEVAHGNVAVAHPSDGVAQPIEGELADRAGSEAGTVFSSMIMEAVHTVDRSLIQLQPLVREELGPRGKEFRQLAAKAARLNERARFELNAGNAFVALDLVLQANSSVEDLREGFERE